MYICYKRKINMGKSTFNEMLTSSEVPVLVDFHATWCGPCKMMAPVLEKLASEIHGTAKIIKVDVDKNPEASAKYQVRSVPTLILFKAGKPVWRESGTVPASKLKQVIEQYK
jgi:thioredoxin 1